MSDVAEPYEPIEELIESFEFFDDWQDRYRYIIDLGRKLPEFDPAWQTAENKVDGCTSQVWLVVEEAEDGSGALIFKGDSDAHIVKGLVAILLTAFSNRPAQDILNTDARALLDRLDLGGHLSPSRSNGLYSMVRRIYDMAREKSAG
ncbi:SufE family protein [Rhodovibrionaceae bacterium A322]